MEKEEIKSSFTPGPWTVDKMDDYGSYRIREAAIERKERETKRVERDQCCAIIEAQDEGNRRLIQEAPLMLSALEELSEAMDNALLVHIFEDEKEAAESWYAAIIENARATIARAKGNQ